MLFDEFRRRKREKTNKFLESKMDENMQDLNKKVKALHKDFKKLEESTKNEVETMRAHLEKQGCKEMNVVLLLLSVLDKNLQEFSQKIETMEEDVQKWPETTKRDLQLQRHELESQGCKENEIARELKSVLDKNLQQLSQKIETLKKNAQELSKTTKCNLQLLRGFLESQEREEQSSRAQQCRMETLLEQLCQRFQSLEQAIEMRQEVPYHDLLLSRRYLENNQAHRCCLGRCREMIPFSILPPQAFAKASGTPTALLQSIHPKQFKEPGIAMLREEMIHLRVLELARGERINNIWTDSRSAFEIGPAQGAVQNRRLCEGQGFFRSVSGGEVEWITPGASDNLHANQDERTACLDSLFRRHPKEHGPQSQ
ncbi:uncharacterized protein LOC115484737 isoform X2 [Serinus canaria]|uniref:uncharacterized protein LOC115484737 isoform X2 n=1 Tax=Serinus canaria TaxID=9135 RepID=UPI0021CD02D1|nr:uncharacterized protein LOC115484737 isoform X2 [Serinus canaria]